MTIELTQRSGIHVLSLAGEFVASGQSDVVVRVSELLDQGATRLILEMSGIGFINSGGLGELVQVTARANTRHARVILASPSPFLAGVLETTRLDRFFDIAPTVDIALSKLA
jgi:anti-sigma B factor antagonist